MSCRSFGVGQSVIEHWWGGAWRGDEGHEVRTEGQASRRLTARAPLEGTRFRVGLGWEMEVDFAEIVFEVDGRRNIADFEASVDPADHFEFGTDFEDAVMHPSVD